MATPSFNAVGFCARYAEDGDRAFDFALDLARKSGAKLNVFYFLNDPYDPSDQGPQNLSHAELEKLAVAKEKDLRLYYDQKAGDYLDVGFRVCYDESWTELHRCLLVREFQVLVLAYPERGAYFAKRHIEDFADRFISPAILVGPGPDEFYLNKPATQLAPVLGLNEENYSELKPEPA